MVPYVYAYRIVPYWRVSPYAVIREVILPHGAANKKKPNEQKEIEKHIFSVNKAVYTAYVAPRRPKSESITYIHTDRRTDGPTDRPTDGHTLL